jgi:biotin carboxyl carrier protein
MKSKTLPLTNTFTRFTFLAITIFACFFLGQSSLNAQTLTATVSPTATCEASTGNNLTFTISRVSGSYGQGSQVSIVIPAGWTAPQTSSATSPGFVAIGGTTGTGTTAAVSSSITGSGPWTILINVVLTAANASFTLTYGGGGTRVTAPSPTQGPYTFTTQASSGGAFSNATSQPIITVNPTPTLSGASQPAGVCAGSGAVIAMTGLLPSSTSTITYTINNGTAQTATGITANASGAAQFTSSALTASNNGQILRISGITVTSATPNCTQSFTQDVTLSVAPTSVGGTLGGAAIVCATANSGTLTLAGNIGNVIRWESSPASATTWTTVTNTNTTNSLDYTNLTSSTQFRAVIQSGACPSINSSVATITVSPASVGGTASANQTICAGATPSGLSVTGITGSVTKWQKSTDNFATAGIDIASSASPTLAGATIGTLTTTTYFRAVVQSGACSEANSSVVTITVNPTSVGGTVGGSTTVCAGTNSGTVTLSGETGSVIRWEFFPAGGAWTTVTGSNTTNSLTYTNLTVTTQYRAVVQSGVCPAVPSPVVATVTVNSASVGGTVSANQTICSGSAPANITLTGSNGSVVKWQSSSDAAFTSPIDIANTTTTLTGASIGALTVTTYFRAVVQSGVCTAANSAVVTVTVNPLPTLSGASQPSSACAGATTVINLTGLLSNSTSTITYTINNGAAQTIAGVVANAAGAASFSTTALTAANNGQTLRITNVTVTSATPTCTQSFAQDVTLSVAPTSVGGTVSGTATVCATSNNGTLTLAGQIGNVIRWESSPASATTWTTVTNTNTTNSLDYTNLTSSTQFRAVIQSGACPSINSSVATITVSPASVGGTASANQTICAGATPSGLSVTGITGSVTKWQKSTDNFATAGIDIASSASPTLAGATIGTLTTTTYFRAVVQSGACSEANSSVVTITVNPTSVGGTVGGSTTVCAGTNSGTVTLSGETGSVIRWEFFPAGGAWTTVTGSNTTNSLTYTNLTVTTQYRAVVQSGVCPAVPSPVVATVTVNSASVGGTVSANQTICSGSAPANITLTGSNGSVVKWQSSSDAAFTYPIDIANTTTTLTGASIGALTATTYFRAVVQSGVCTAANSAVVTVTVNPLPTLSGASQPSSACAGATTVINLTGLLSNSTSTITYTINNGAAQTIAGVVANAAGAASFSTTALTAANNGQTLRITNVTVTSATPNCTQSFAQDVTLSVAPTSVGGTVSGTATVCATSNNGTLTLAGQIGNVIRWESSPASATTWTTVTNTNTTNSLDYTNLTSSTQFRAVIQSGACPSINSSVATITVSPASVGGTASANQTICAGATPSGLSVAGITGSVTRWQKSTDNFATAGIDIPGSSTATLTSATIGALTATTYFRAVIKSGACNEANSSAVTITVDPTSNGGTIPNQTICSGTTPADINLTGNVGVVLRWEVANNIGFATNGGNTVTTITTNSTTLLGSSIGVLTSAHYVRVFVRSGSCAEQASNIATISITPQTIPGIIGGAATVCFGNNNGTLTLSGNNGSVVRWESSIDGGASWTAISNNTSSQSYNNLTITSQFRVIVQNGVCTPVNTPAVTVTVNPLPTLTNATQFIGVCAGSTAVINLTGLLPSRTFTITYTINGGAVQTVTGVTANASGAGQFTTPALTAANNGQTLRITGITTTSVSPNCSQTFTEDVTLIVAPTTIGGTAGGTTTVCVTNNSGTLTLTGHTGNVIRWESSLNGQAGL